MPLSAAISGAGNGKDDRAMGMAIGKSRMRGLEPEALSSMIDDIYDCALSPERWPDVLQKMSGQLNAAYAAISLSDSASPRPILAAHSPWDEDMLRILYEQFVLDIPGVEGVLTGDLDMPQSSLANLAEEVFQQSRFYREWVAPQGLRDGCVAKFAQTANRFGIVSVVTRADRDIISAEERRYIQVLSPHFRRAALIGDLLNQTMLSVTAYRAALDGLRTPVFLTDGASRLMLSNAAAEALLSAGRSLRSVGQTLQAVMPAAGAALTDAVQRAGVDGGAALGGRGIGIPLSMAGAEPMIAYVLPLARSDIRSSFDGATVAVFVSLAAGHIPLPETMLITLFNLTPAEARVTTRIVGGRSPLDVSREMGLSENTMKTHLGRIYAKTNTSRQAELVALLSSLAGPQMICTL